MKLIDGKKIAAQVKQELADEVDKLGKLLQTGLSTSEIDLTWWLY